MYLNKYKIHRKKNISISSFVILVGLIMTVIMQFFLETPYYSLARLVLYGIFFSSVAFQLPHIKIKKNKFLTIYLTLTFLAIFNELLIFLFTGTNSLELVIHVSLSFVLLFLGYNISISSKQKDKIVAIYIIVTTILGLFVIFFYGDGFNISQQYFLSSKNQVGPFISSSSLICLFSLLINQQKDTLLSNKFFLITMFFINFATLLSIRNRAGIVSLIMCLCVYFLFKAKIIMKGKTFIIFPIVLLLMGGILYSGIITPVINYVYDSLFLNYDVTDINSLSANRTDTYGRVIEFVKEFPFFGELSYFSDIATPHNYLLNILRKYGIFGMLPLLVLYFYIWLFVIKTIVLDKKYDISLYLMLFMLVISLFEYTYPYSPLTTVSLTWFLLGYYLNPIHKKQEHKLLKMNVK